MKIYVLVLIFLIAQINFLFSDDLNWLNFERITDIEIKPSQDSIMGFAELKFVNLSAKDSISLDLIGLSIDSVLIDLSNTTYLKNDSILQIYIQQVYTPGETLDVKIFYKGIPSLVSTPFASGGLFINTSLVFSTHAPFGLKCWLPCLDAHRHKAIVRQNITMPEDFYIFSNGELDSIIQIGNKRKFFWTENSKLSPYLQGIAAYNYTISYDTIGSIPFYIATYPQDSTKAAYDLRRVDQMLYEFEDKFGSYPFCKIAYAEVELSGAMENQNCILTGSVLITGNGAYEITMGHELSHQWWGDYLTPENYAEVWIAEGWATYSEGMLVELFDGIEQMHIYLNGVRNEYLSWEATYGFHTTYDPPFQYYYSKLTYERPGAMLYALRFSIGDSLFYEGAKECMSIYGDSIASWQNIAQVYTTVCGREMNWFFSQWLLQAGTPSGHYEIFSKEDSFLIICWTNSNTTSHFTIEFPVCFYSNDSIINSDIAIAVSADSDTVFNYYSQVADSAILDIYNTQFVSEKTNYNIEILSALSLDEKIKLDWKGSEFSGCIGYNVYIADYPGNSYTKVNTSIVIDTFYTIENLTNNNFYSFYVNFEIQDNWESHQSDTVICSPVSFPFDREILLVDETEGGSGSVPIQPTDVQIDSAYNSIFSGISHDIYHCDSALPEISFMGHYKTIFWHSDEYTSTSQIIDNSSLIQSYISAGGKIIISGWRVFEGSDVSLLSVFNLDSAIVIAQKNFERSEGLMGFPEVFVDSALMLPPWNGKMDRATYFKINAGDTLGVWGSGCPQSGNPTTVGKTGQTNYIINGYPLYFVRNSDSRDFVEACFQYLGQTYIIEEINNYPENIIIKSQINRGILFEFPLSFLKNSVILKIYDISGREVYNRNILVTSFLWEWNDNNNNELPNGSYIINIISNNNIINRKVFRIE